MVAAKIVIPDGLRPAAKKARVLGWEITMTKGHHLRWRSPTGALVFLSSTPRGGRHAIENSLSQLKKNGLVL